MKVYVAVSGIYSSQYVAGVYDTPERAIAAHHKPGDQWIRRSSRTGDRRYVFWENNRDWEAAIQIEPFELVTEGEQRPPDKAEVIDYETDHSRVIYTPEPV